MWYYEFDEIQNVQDFQKLVDSLFIKDNVDIYLMGLNAYMLSGELVASVRDENALDYLLHKIEI